MTLGMRPWSWDAGYEVMTAGYEAMELGRWA